MDALPYIWGFWIYRKCFWSSFPSGVSGIIMSSVFYSLGYILVVSPLGKHLKLYCPHIILKCFFLALASLWSLLVNLKEGKRKANLSLTFDFNFPGDSVSQLLCPLIRVSNSPLVYVSFKSFPNYLHTNSFPFFKKIPINLNNKNQLWFSDLTAKWHT